MKKLSVAMFVMLIVSTVQAQTNISANKVTAKNYNGSIQADAQSGSDACAKIANAISSLPSTGGVVDARGILGVQTCAANPFAGVTKPVTLLLSAVTITTSACWGLPSKTHIVGAGIGVSTLKLANNVNTCYLIQNADFVGGNDHISVRNTTLDGNALNQSPNEGAGERTGTVLFKKVTNFYIEQNEILNAYHYHVELLNGSRTGWVRGNMIDGSVNGTGVLAGSGPGSGGSEAYDIEVSGNAIRNVGGGNCMFSTGSDTPTAYGTSGIKFDNNLCFNAGDVSIEIGDSTYNSQAIGNTIWVAPAVTISSISRSGNVVTATVSCSWASGMGCLTAFGKASVFTVAGVTDATFNGTFTVSTVNYGSNSFTWAQVLGNASSSGGTAVRQGNLALLARSTLNATFKANVVYGNGATNQDCEMDWHDVADNAPSSQNVNFDDVCNNSGRYGFSTVASTAGSVTQVTHSSKLLNSTTSDYLISSNTLAMRLLGSGGYFTAGAALAGTSFNQTNDLVFRPGTGGTAKFLVSSTSVGVGISNADFTPATLLHIKSASGANDFRIEQSADSNTGFTLTNTARIYGFGIRAASGEAFIVRTGTAPTLTTDILTLTTAGLLTAVGGLQAGAGTTIASTSNLAQFPATLSTTAATSDNVAITGVTASSKCSLTPTNASAATNMATTYVSAKSSNQITVTHTATASMTFDIMCSAQ